MIRRTTRAGAILAIGGLLAMSVVFAGAQAAFADDTATLSPSTQTAEYGQGWYIQGQVTAVTTCDSSCYGTLTVTSGSVSRSFAPADYTVYQGSFEIYDQMLLPQTDLGVGTHSISVSSNGADPISTAPVTVIITKAAIATTTTISADPNNSENAIISAQLSGNYIDQLPSCYCEEAGSYGLPAGTWNLSVTDSHGKTVLSKQTQQAAGGNPYFVSYWPNVPAGETFSATATFTAAAASSGNFTISTQKFSWTSAKATDTGSSSLISGSTKPKPAVSKGFQPPIWLLLLVLVVAVLLLALDIVLFVRRRMRPGAAKVAGEPVQ
jgi:hypothetical protein